MSSFFFRRKLYHFWRIYSYPLFALYMFYRQIVIHRGLPFAVQFPQHALINAATLTDTQLDAEVSKGFEDIAAGRKRPFKQAAADLAREFSL